MIRRIKLYGTTDSGGDLTVESKLPVAGLLRSIQWIDGDFADGVDAVISFMARGPGDEHTVLTLTDANVDAWYHPGSAVDDNAGVNASFNGTQIVYTLTVIDGLLKLVVSDGGSGKTGGCIVYIEQ